MDVYGCMNRIHALKPGEAMDVDLEFFVTLADSNVRSRLFDSVRDEDIQRVVEQLRIWHRVEVSVKPLGGFTIFRPTKDLGPEHARFVPVSDYDSRKPVNVKEVGSVGPGRPREPS